MPTFLAWAAGEARVEAWGGPKMGKANGAALGGWLQVPGERQLLAPPSTTGELPFPFFPERILIWWVMSSCAFKAQAHGWVLIPSSSTSHTVESQRVSSQGGPSHQARLFSAPTIYHQPHVQVRMAEIPIWFGLQDTGDAVLRMWVLPEHCASRYQAPHRLVVIKERPIFYLLLFLEPLFGSSLGSEWLAGQNLGILGSSFFLPQSRYRGMTDIQTAVDI